MRIARCDLYLPAFRASAGVVLTARHHYALEELGSCVHES